jgi:hypothetical protein
VPPSKEFEAFTDLVDRVIAVPHSVIKERVEAHRKQADKNPRKRGPKPNGKKRAAKPKR